MADSFSANAFANNFIRGYSFVDSIKANKRAEARLEQRLSEERDERAFQRRRTLESDRNVRTDRAYVAGQREIEEDVRVRRARGERTALDPDASDEDLMRDADVSPTARAEMIRRVGQERFEEAFKEVQANIPQAGVSRPQTLSDGVTAEPSAQLPGEPAARSAPAFDAAAAPDTTFAPTRGQGSLQVVSEEDIETSDPEFKEKGFANQLLDRAVGSVQQVTRGIGNLSDVVTQRTQIDPRTGQPLSPGPRAAGEAFVGESFISTEFVPSDELELITDPQQRADIDARNSEIIEEQKAKARDPARNKLARPISRQGAVQEGGEILRDAAQLAERQVVQRYEEFLGTGSALEEIALNDPAAAAMDYLESRNTLMDAAADMVPAVDARMVPVMSAYADQISGEIAASQPGSREHAINQRRLNNVNDARNVIASTQPAPDKQAGIKPPGLKIGDAPRVENVVNTILDPSRPARTTITSQQIHAAATVAGRIVPTRNRLNSKTISALATLAEAGWVDKATLSAVLQTGAWPPGKDPNAIKSISGGWAITEGGAAFKLPATDDKSKVIDRSIDQAAIDAMLMGAASTGMSPERSGEALGIMSDYAAFVRKHYNTKNQESMVALGRSIGQSILLSAERTKEYANDWKFWTNPENAPSGEDVFLNPVMRRDMANDFEVRLVPMPAVGERGDLDLDPFMRSIEEGTHGAFLQKALPDMTEDDLLYVWWVLNAPPEAIAAANLEG